MTDVKKLNPDEARELLAGDAARAVDVTPGKDLHETSIPGAIRVPDREEESLSELPTDQTIVVVADEDEEAEEVARRLAENGREVATIDGGLDAWFGRGLPEQPRPDFEFRGPEHKPPGT